MRRAAFGFYLAIAAFIDCPAWASNTLEQSTVAGWDLSAYSDDQGQFTACYVGAPYQSGISLGFIVYPNFQWEMDLYNSNWSLRKGDQFVIGFSIDGGPQTTRSATASSSHLVSIPLSAEDDTFPRLKHGRLLTVQASGGQFSFRLDGTARSLQAVVECTSRWNNVAKGQTSSDPFSGQSASSDPFSGTGGSNTQTRPAEYAAEAMPVLTGMLNAASITGYQLLSPDKAKDLLPAFDAVWTADHMFGGLRVIPDVKLDQLGDIMSNVAAGDARLCKGKFGSYMPADHTSPPVLRRLVDGCDEPGSSWEVHYTLLNRTKGGMYMFAAVGIPGADGENAVRDADANFVRAVIGE